MTPDALHYALVLTGWVAVPSLLLAALVLHRRMRSRWSLLLLLGLMVILSGRVLQILSPVEDLSYEEFRGIVVSSGEFPVGWYAGRLASAGGLLISAAGALGFAFSAPRSTASG